METDWSKLARSLIERKSRKKVDILEKCFGEPMYANVFSMNEVRDWIKLHEAMLKNGGKAVVLKVNAENLRRIGKNINLGNSTTNKLVIAILGETSKEFLVSALVKYERLDENLEKLLDKGNGVLIVEA